MANIIKPSSKLSHKQFRAILKKFRRKKKRQQYAIERDAQEILDKQKRENSPSFKENEAERQRNSDLYDEFEERERCRQHREWLVREERAQLEFRKKQYLMEQEKMRLEEERKRILEEFEKQQLVESKAEEENQKIKSQKEEALQEALANLPEGDGPWHNPIAPLNYNAEQEGEQCQFFVKTGCCRFGERCSRGHKYLSISSTILIKGMYSHFSIDQISRDDYDTDIALEYEDKETYQDFKNFYYDVLPEFKKCGRVVQFKVCNNHEPHLRGNVYVQYSKDEEAVEAYKKFNARFYAGRQLTCEFTHVIKWRSAICGLFFRNMCPKGINCNFLHVFRNPSDEFWEADQDFPTRSYSRNFHSSRSHYSRSHHSYSDRSNSHHRHRRSRTPEYRSSSRRHSRSPTESDEENSSSHRHKKGRKSPSSSVKRMLISRSPSRSPSSNSGESERSHHIKSKHKKKSKKHKKKKKKSTSNYSN